MGKLRKIIGAFLNAPDRFDELAERIARTDQRVDELNRVDPAGSEWIRERLCKDRESFVRDLRALYEHEVLPLAKAGRCGAVYTQLSDVEDETNGLLTFDRAVSKLTPEELADLAPRLQAAVRGE